MEGNVREGGGEDIEINKEINVKKLIDVMMVMIIILMVEEKMEKVDVKVDMKEYEEEKEKRKEKKIYVKMKEDIRVRVGNDKVERERIGDEIEGLYEKDKEKRILMSEEKNVDYGEMMRVMNMIREDGYMKIEMVGIEKVGEDKKNEEKE